MVSVFFLDLRHLLVRGKIHSTEHWNRKKCQEIKLPRKMRELSAYRVLQGKQRMWRQGRKKCTMARDNDRNMDHRIVYVFLESVGGHIIERTNGGRGRVCLTWQKLL